MTTGPRDSMSGSSFTLISDGHEIATFAELMIHKKLPGKHTPPTLTLKRGRNTSTELGQWHDDVLAHGPAQASKNCTPVMVDTGGPPVARYHLEMAWPSKLEVGSSKTEAGALVVEAVTLVCQQIQEVAGGPVGGGAHP